MSQGIKIRAVECLDMTYISTKLNKLDTDV